MPQSLTQNTVNTFIGGLITEASELNFPENASTDELNCSLNEDGSRQRRKGIKVQTGGSASPFSLTEGELVHSITWDNVSEEGSLSFLILQVGDFLYFYNKASYPVSSGKHSFSYDMTNVKAPNGVQIEEAPIQAAVIRGKLIVVHPGCDIIKFEYDSADDTFSVEELPAPKVRDFEWNDDTSRYFKDRANISAGRRYDMYNVGWQQRYLDEYQGRYGEWPKLTHPWYTAKDPTDGTGFNASEWHDYEHGTSLAANGHFILDLFNKDRRGALIEDKGIYVSLPVDRTFQRFSTVHSYAGRVWFAGLGDNKLYFSKVVEDDEDIVKFYQINDPTAEDLNDLVDSDGGVISLSEAQNIRQMITFGSGLIVFADNGVWEVKGPDDIFKATEYSVTKVSSIGLTNPRSFVDAEGTPFWWSRFGIHTITRQEVSLATQEANISQSSIQTFFDEIPVASKVEATGIYDSHNKRVRWLYSTDASNNRKYNGVLNLDISIRAFYPWSFEDSPTNSYYVVGGSFFEGYGTQQSTENVTVNGVDVTVNGVDVTTTSYGFVSETDPRTVYLAYNPANNKIYFADTSQYTFTDWATEEEYSSYAVASFDFMGDLTTTKRGLVLTTYFKRTEDGFVSSGSEYLLSKPSKCILKSYWDLKTNPSNGGGQQVYRLTRLPLVDEGNLSLFPIGRNVIINKTRLRGKGRVLQIRFESEGTNDFHLIGYELISLKHQSI